MSENQNQSQNPLKENKAANPESKPKLKQTKIPVNIKEYSEAWVVFKVREELGFDSKNLYKDDDDANVIHGQNEMQKEIILAERYEKANAVEFKLKQQGEIFLMQQKQSKEKEALKSKTIGKRRRQRDSDDESGEIEDSYRSNSSGYSGSSGQDYNDRSYSEDESSYEHQRKDIRDRRQSKLDDKQKQKERKYEYQIDGSEEDYSSSSSDSYFDRKNDDQNRKRKRSKDAQKDGLSSLMDKPVELKDFQKICIKRRDLVRWIDHPDYQEGIRGGFVRVTYHKSYVIGQIERVKLGNDAYRVDQKETKMIIELKNGDKLKEFKLNAISDQKCTQAELEKLQRDNKKLALNYEFLNQIKQQFAEATKFQQDKDEVKKLLHKQAFDKIKSGNYKGLNLTEIKIKLQGEIAMTEQALQISIQDGAKLSDRNEIYEKLEELKDIFQRVLDRIRLDQETSARLNKPTKVGANLKSQNELQEWLEKQHFLEKNRQEEGSNCFSYFRPKQIKQSLVQTQNIQTVPQTQNALVQEISLLRLRSQKSVSGLQTETSSIQDKNLSYFEKMQSLKYKIQEVHRKQAKTSEDGDGENFKEMLKYVRQQDVQTLTDGHQPAHPDWLKSRLSFAQQFESTVNFKFGKSTPENNKTDKEVDIVKPVPEKKSTTERERLQAQLKQTLTEFKQQNANKEKQNGQASQGGQGATGKQNTRQIGNYIVGKTLGQGTFGKVREGTHLLTQEKVAIKILEKEKINDQADITRVMREIHILKIVRHPNIVQLYEIIETSKQLFLIMEYAPGGELFDYIVKKKRLQDSEACRFFHQILAGIEYLHANKICHRDLKPENLLLDENMNIKIVDFGLSNTYKSANDTLKTACGSPCYASPEMIAGKRYSGLDTDIWSLGVILYAMTVGYLPFEDPDTNKLYKKILSCDYLVPGYVTKPAKDMMKKILQVDPKKRYKLDEIKKHPWYVSVQQSQLDGIIIGKEKIPILNQIQLEMESSPQLKTIEGIDKLILQVEMNKHNPVTATYYLLIKKYERNTDQNLVFGKFTRDKRLLEQLKENGGSAKNLPVNSSGPMAIENPGKANSNSIAVIKENYGALEKNNFNLMMQSQPKSEQKFRSQTNDKKQRMKPDGMIVGAKQIQNASQNQVIQVSNQGSVRQQPQNIKKQTVKQFLESTLGKEKGIQSFNHSNIAESMQNDSLSTFNVILNDKSNTIQQQSIQETINDSNNIGSYASANFILKNQQTLENNVIAAEQSLQTDQRYNSTSYANVQSQLRQKGLKITRTIIPNIQLDKKGQQVRIQQALKPKLREALNDNNLLIDEQQVIEPVTQSEVQLINHRKIATSVENSRSQTRSVVADKNRAFILNDFLPKVEISQTQNSIDQSTNEIFKTKEGMKTASNMLGVSGKKVTSSVEAIAARIAQKSMSKNEPYEGVFTSQGVIIQNIGNQDFGLVQRSIPLSKQYNSKPLQALQNQRVTQMNFFSNERQKLASQAGSLVKGLSLDQNYRQSIAKNSTDSHQTSGNTSILSYNTQTVKGFTQAQSALQNYMRNRVANRNEKNTAAQNSSSYFNNTDQYDSIQQASFMNQSIPIAAQTIYRSKKQNTNSSVGMKHHDQNSFVEANSLQSLIGANSLNVTVQGGKKNNFFIAKEQLKSDVYQNNGIQMNLIAQNAVKANLVKMQPISRGITINNQSRGRANPPQQIMPYSDQSFASQQFNQSQISVEQRSGSTGRAVMTTNKMAATIGQNGESWVVQHGNKAIKGATQTKYNFHPKNQYYLL